MLRQEIVLGRIRCVLVQTKDIHDSDNGGVEQIKAIRKAIKGVLEETQNLLQAPPS